MPYNQAHNLFQLWKLNGECLPFKARKETWRVSPSHYMLVEKVEIAKWPYGKAWGAAMWRTAGRANLTR